MFTLNTKQKWTLGITIIALIIMTIFNNTDSVPKEYSEFKTENLFYYLNKDVTIDSSVSDNISTDYYTLDNSFKFGVNRYDISYKDSILNKVKEDFNRLGEYTTYNKNNLEWCVIKFKDIPINNGGCFILETDKSIYYIEANSNKEDVLDIIDRMILKNESVISANKNLETLNTKTETKITKDTVEDKNIIYTDSIEGINNEAKFVIHFNNKVDPMKAVKVYCDNKCEDDSLVFTWNDAYETSDGVDIIVKGDSNILLSQDRLDYNILDTNWGNMSKLFIKVLNEENNEQSFIIPITFNNGIKTPTAFTKDGKTIEWLSVDGVDEYRIYKSDLDREGRLARELGYINEKPEYVSSVSNNTKTFTVNEDDRDCRFYITAVKKYEINNENSEDTEVIFKESLFSNEVQLNKLSDKLVDEFSECSELDFNDTLEYQDIRQVKYLKSSVDQRTELELKRIETNGHYEYPLEVIPHYIMMGSYSSDYNDIEWSDDEIASKEILESSLNTNGNNKINILINEAKKEVENSNDNNIDKKYYDIINFDNKDEEYISKALINKNTKISLKGYGKLNDREYLNEILDSIFKKNIILPKIEVILYQLIDDSLDIEYSDNMNTEILDKFLIFSKELYKHNDILELSRWIKELHMGGNVEDIVENLKLRNYTQNDINTYLLDLILKANNIESKIVYGEKNGEAYRWNLFYLDNIWYQYDINDNKTSKELYKTDLNIKELYDYDVSDNINTIWYTDKYLEASNEKDLINIICSRYSEPDKIVIKLVNGFTFKYSEEFGEKLVEQLINYNYTINKNFSYNVVGKYLIILK